MKKQPSPESIRTTLDEILPRVQKPSRYVGLERNLVRKSWDEVAVHVALAFPDAYEIGMCHQGSQILYHLVNRRPDAVAERCYAPMPDMAEALRSAALPLYTLESYHAVAEFDLVGISLQSELNYINVPYLLDLAGIPRWASDRADGDPIVLGGGPCTANPEPVADFFDAILIGDAEAGLDAILDAVRDGLAAGDDRASTLRRLAAIEGVYVPGFYRWQPPTHEAPGAWQQVNDAGSMPVKRVWVDRLDAADQPEAPIVPYAEVIQDRLGMEIMRGCTQGCRFCQAGYWYRPVREHEPATVAERIQRQVDETGFEQVGLLSLSSADYSQIEGLVDHLADALTDQRVSISLPSLRADAFSVGLAEAVSRVRKSGFTFAPETGSDRLRRVINKTFTNADMIRAAEDAFAKGWNMIKVYAMIGLPTETDDDLEELAVLARDLVETGRRFRGRKAEVKVSVGCFVPKAWTAFQWQPFVAVDEQLRRIHILRDHFKRIKGARLSWADPAESALEALLSRGDRRLGATIARAHDLGAVFDGWSDHLDLDAWRQAMVDTGVDLDVELGERELAAALPWDIIDAGLRKNYLKAEWRRALGEKATEDCKWGACVHCGIPGDGDDTVLAGTALPVLGSEEPAAVGADAAPYRRRQTPRVSTRPLAPATQAPVYRRFRVRFEKTGDARWLSHRQVMDTLERALRAGRAPVRFTEGFNPHIRLSMGAALGVGQEGAGELFDVDCTSPLTDRHIAATNSRLPDGLQLLDATALLPGAPSLGKMVAAGRYHLTARTGIAWPLDRSELPETIRAGILEWQTESDGSLTVVLNQRQSDGPAPTVKKLLEALDVEAGEIPLVPVRREQLVLRPPQRHVEPAAVGVGS